MTHPTNLYRHFNSEGRLLYVGVSLSAIGRLAGHRTKSDWFPNIARVEIETLPDRISALCAEKDAIANESPQFNVRHQGRKSSVVRVGNGAISEMIIVSGLTNKELAAKAGVDNATAWRWRTGRRRPSIDQLAPLARALGCEPSELIPEGT